MFDKIRELALTVATIGLVATAGASNATVVSISDAGNDVDTFPWSSPLTLDNSAVDTVAVFDSISKVFAFLGVGTGNQTFSFINNGIKLVSIGNVNPTKPIVGYTTAEVTIGTTTIDLLLTPDTPVLVNVSGAFTLSTNFVTDSNVDGTTYDFRVSAVPLPAAGFLLLGALGGLGFMGRRRRKAS